MKNQHRISQKVLAIVLAVGLIFSGIPLFTAPASAADNISQQPGVNLTENGDFETGTTAGWRNDGGEKSMSTVAGRYETGNYIGQSVRDGSTDPGTNFWGLSNRVAAQAGSTYRFSVAVKTENTQSLIIKVNWIDGSGNYLSQTDYILDNEPNAAFSQAWKNYTGTYTAPWGAAYGELRVLYQNPSSQVSKVWVDDAVIEVAPAEFQNGDFEHGDTSGWRNDGGDKSISAVAGCYKTGSYIGQSVRDGSKDPGDNSWGLSNRTSVISGKTYRFSVAVKAENTASVILKVDWIDGSGNYLSSNDYLLLDERGAGFNLDWKKYSSSYKAPDGAKFAEIRVLYKCPANQTAKLSVDDAAVQLLPEPTSQIINGDFEQGNLNYWDWDGEPDSVEAVKDSGTGSYEGVSERTSSQTAGDWWGLDYKALVTPGGQYYFSSRVKTENTNDAHIKIDWLDETGNGISTSFIRGGLTGNNEWDTYVGSVTAPSNAKYARLRFLQGLPKDSSKLYVDDVKFDLQTEHQDATDNGDFELGSLDNWMTFGTNSASVVPGSYQSGQYIGKSSYSSAESGTSEYGLGYMKKVAPGSIFKFSAAVKTDNVKDAHVKIDWYDNAGNLIYANDVGSKLQGTNDWHLLQDDYTAPLKSSYAVISFLHSKPADGTANLYVDDMKFYTEPLVNGDFENGNLFHWEVSGSAQAVKGGYKIGSYMAESDRSASDTKAYWSGLNYYVPVDTAKKYEFSSAIKTENCRQAYVKISWLDSSKNPLPDPNKPTSYLTDYLLKTPIDGDSDWQLISQYFTPPTNAAYAMLSFCHENPKSGTGRLFIDNVYFKEYSAADAAAHFKESGGKAKILFTATPSGSFGAAFHPLDDKYAIELYDQNYAAESTNYYCSTPLNETNVLSYGIAYPDRLPFVTNKIADYDNKNPTVDEIKNYVNNGGGLLINMGYVGYGDEQKVVDNINSFLKDFGAQLDWRKVTDGSHKEIYDYSAKYAYYSTTNIKKTDLTSNVSKIWYPGGKDTYTVTTYAMKALDDSWTTDVQTESTATPNDGAAPILMAHRTYGKGRIVILTMDPRFGVASGSHEAYGNYILGDNAGDKQLYRNIYDWLGEPSMEQGNVFKKASEAPEITTVSARKPAENVADSELDSKLTDPSNGMVNMNQYKGLIGIQSNLSGGTSSVEDLCSAAVNKGYQYLVFAEDYTKMTEDKYNDLVSRCDAINAKNSGFSAIPGLSLPSADKDEEPRYYGKGKRIVFNLKRWPTQEEATSPEWYHLLFNQSWPSVIVSEPNLNANSPWQLMFYTGIAIDTYNGNTQIDEASDLYRRLVSSDYRLIPVAVSYLKSVDELNDYNDAVTYVYSKNVSEIKNNIQTFGGSGTSYSSTGPKIGFKYASATSATYAGSGEELFTNQKFALDISASSDAQLKDVTVYRDADVFEKFNPQSTSFKKTLYLTKDANHAFTVVVTDVNGKRAVSNSVRTGSPYHNFTMCTDKQNVIHNFYGNEGSDGIIQSFWLSGKDLGQLYINKSASDIAPAGEDASWAAASVVEGMPKVWTQNAKLGGDDPAVSTVSSRSNMLSSDDAVVVRSAIQDDVFQGYTQYTTFKPKLQGDNILMVEGNYTTKKQVTLGDSVNNLEMILFRIMGNYAHEPFKSYVYSPDYNTKIKGTMDRPLTSVTDAFLPALTGKKLSEGGYLGMWTSKTGNIMMFPLDTDEHDISFGLTTSRRVFQESGSEIYRNYLAYGFNKPGTTIAANTPVKYKLLFVVDNGTATDETHADEIRSAYRLGTTQGMDADITNGKLNNSKFTLDISAVNNYASVKLAKRYMPNDVLPIIVSGTQKNWDAVEYDYTTRQFRKLGGIDGSLYDAADVSSGDRNLFIGNPIVSSDQNLVISLQKGDNGELKAEVHNPTDQPVTATISNSPALSDVISFNKAQTFQPGESEVYTIQTKSSYSFECGGPVDAALNNAVATADSTDGDSLPQKAIDGLDYTGWKSSNTAGEHWLQLDLGKPYKIDRFVVKHTGAGGSPSPENTSDYTIQYQSQDSGEWINAVTVEGNTKNVAVHDISPIEARYVRILVTKPNSSGNSNAAAINAFEVYPVSVPASPSLTQSVPKAPTVTGITSGVTVKSAVLDWQVEDGLKDSATLSKDGGAAQIISHSTNVAQTGSYVLTVNAINPKNGLASATRLSFKVDNPVTGGGSGDNTTPTNQKSLKSDTTIPYSFQGNSDYYYLITTADGTPPKAESSNPLAVSVSLYKKVAGGYLYKITSMGGGSAVITTTASDGSKTSFTASVKNSLKCDTTAPYTFKSNDSYCCQVFSSESAAPSVSSSNPWAVTAEYAGKSAKGYLFKINNVGTGAAIITVRTQKGAVTSFVAKGTVPGLLSDTPYRFAMKTKSIYQFKFTPQAGAGIPEFVTGNSSVMKLVSVRKTGNAYFCRVEAEKKGCTAVYTLLNGKSAVKSIVSVN